MAAWSDELAEVAQWPDGLERVYECIEDMFRRPEPRRRALEYLKGLLSPVERKNGWQLAERAGGRRHSLSGLVPAVGLRLGRC